MTLTKERMTALELREIIASLYVTQERFAGMVGVAPRTMRDWCKDGVGSPMKIAAIRGAAASHAQGAASATRKAPSATPRKRK